MKVEKATQADCKFILGWLKREHDEDGEGFWSNREIIKKAQERGDLWVIREGGDAVAFQVGDYGTDIVNVRKDLQRGFGYGTALFEASLTRAMQGGVNVLRGECSPKTSLSFWQKMGFERYGDLSESAPVLVRLAIKRTFELPIGLPRVDVRISFYPQDALYTEKKPIDVHHISGARFENGSVMLERRVIALAELEPTHRDLVTRIEVDGVERCFGKAKHPEAEVVGMVRDTIGGCFYIDTVKPS